MPECNPSAKTALDPDMNPTINLPPAKNTLANIEIIATFSFIVLILHFEQLR